MSDDRRGFSLIEMIVTMIVLAVVATIAIPRAIRSTPSQQVERAARALTRDLEVVRMRAIAAKRVVRVMFDQSGGYYTAFLDLTPDRSGTISGTEEEVRASGLVVRGVRAGMPIVELREGVRFGVGVATAGPQGAAVSDVIALGAEDWVEFDAHGMIIPPGRKGVIYLTHELDANAVAAVTISGASAFRAWRYRDGEWTP
jgi:prepilin-type N-terminal cleavage/methylation domain-containing protein